MHASHVERLGGDTLESRLELLAEGLEKGSRNGGEVDGEDAGVLGRGIEGDVCG